MTDLRGLDFNLLVKIMLGRPGASRENAPLWRPTARPEAGEGNMDYNYESHELLQDAVDEGMIDEKSAACGVAKQCIDQGYDSLSPAQRAVYDLQVVPHLKKIAERQEIEDRMRGMPD